MKMETKRRERLMRHMANRKKKKIGCDIERIATRVRIREEWVLKKGASLVRTQRVFGQSTFQLK